ncbi:hypothetical protein F4680DRAFT_465086 [Xylaria scruposa]|nr:hypothetical protein F4680DRAFT_465086 [Xylaria scruposa]
MALVGAPANPRPIPGRPVPVLASTVRGLSSAKFDCGDIQIAYHNIGLASTAQTIAYKPRSGQIDDYIRRLADFERELVWYTTQPPNIPGNGSSEATRRKKMRVLFSAIRTLRGFKNLRWNWDRVITIDILQDQALNTPQWAMMPAPLPWPQLQARLAAHNTRLRHRIDTFEPVGNFRLSAQEFEINSDDKCQQLVRYWDALPPTGGFLMRDEHGAQHTMHAMNWPEDGNSLWHCLHHWRHRLYIHLERQSWTEIEQLVPGSERLWGRMSILRALHLNTPDSGPPMYGHFQGMMQVIADYFRKEVILFIRPQYSMIGAIKPEYDYRVFGYAHDGRVNGQLFFVTDEIPGQYQVVTHLNNDLLHYSCRRGPQDPHNPGPLSFSHRSNDDRFGWINAPWMPPVPTRLVHPPVLDPLFQVPYGSAEWAQFAGLGVAIDDDARYGNGAVPVLPDPVTAGWQIERMAPLPGPDPYPAFPYGFGNRMIVTGVYEDANGREWWPQWNNLSAYRAHQFRQLAIERDLPTTPHKLSHP